MQDALGSTLGLVEKDGRVSSRYHYDEFGTPLDAKKFDLNWPGPDNLFGYTGLGYDFTSSNTYARARYYEPEIGRFISEDTYKGQIDNPLSLNLYTYVHNNPLSYSDPTGHWVHIVVGALVGAVIGGGGNALTQYLASGKIDWGEVAINAASGSISGAIAATGIGLIGQMAINAGISGVNSATVSMRANNFDWGSLAVNIGLGGISGAIGGSGVFSNKIKELWFGAQYARYESGRVINAILYKEALIKAGVMGTVRAAIGNVVSNISSLKYPDLISQIQLMLGVNVTGDYNEETMTAYAALQKEAGIKADGIVTQDSLKKISKYFGNVYFQTPTIVDGRATVTSSTFGK
ncbi:tRNA(Glu)-specific nuclease WapA precursor [compost metagenome]